MLFPFGITEPVLVSLKQISLKPFVEVSRRLPIFVVVFFMCSTFPWATFIDYIVQGLELWEGDKDVECLV